MSCPTHEEISAFHDGELPAETMAQVGTHVRACPECTATLRNMERLDAAASGRAPTAHCLLPEELAELVDGVADDGLLLSAQAHVENCDHCRAAWQDLQAALSESAMEASVAAAAPVAARPRLLTFAWPAVAVAAALLIGLAVWHGGRAPTPGTQPETPRIAKSSPQSTPVEKPEAPIGPGEPQAAPTSDKPASVPAPKPPDALIARAPKPQPGRAPRRATPSRRPTRPSLSEEPVEEPGVEEVTPLPEIGTMALKEGGSLLGRWRRAGGDASGFSLEDLEELAQELPGDRGVLRALVERLEGEQAKDPTPLREQELQRRRMELEAVEATAPDTDEGEPGAPAKSDVESDVDEPREDTGGEGPDVASPERDATEPPEPPAAPDAPVDPTEAGGEQP